MRLRRTLNYHNLKRGRVRQTWNKYNLFNLWKLGRHLPNTIKRTYFQQKWVAKSLTRAYHGEHVRETKWERMFSRRLLSVANMDPAYLAKYDGSEQAAGRGSGYTQPEPWTATPWQLQGKEPEEKIAGGVLKQLRDRDRAAFGENLRERAEQTASPGGAVGGTPYMSMTYAPLERRIDVAIHRALFASSVRQARQYVIHGAVKVNGQVMTYSNYLLNPGDMFQVDPEFVLTATGQPKNPTAVPTAKRRRRQKIAKLEAAIQEEEKMIKIQAEEAAMKAAMEAGQKAATAKAAQEATEKEAAEKSAAEEEGEAGKVSKKLRFLANVARQVLDAGKDDLSAKKKQHMRAFVQEARDAQSKLGRPDGKEVITDELLGSVTNMLKELVIHDPNVADRAAQSGAFTAVEMNAAKGQPAEAEKQEASAAEQKTLVRRNDDWEDEEEEEEQKVPPKEKLAKTRINFNENPVDESKPYATPWQPRKYMSPFAFIPRYLEVNQNICAAVYLRHPVARPGRAEVPTPFPDDLHQLAFNWYLRRR